MILAGPTGSGKSTTMASMLDYRNHKMPGHIVTIEDPIEFIYKPRRSIFTQREVGIDTNDWKIAVQSAMRQAPDVVCIGEVRSEASMEYALQLAQTGHLCVFTIHANTAAQTIERIINFYQEDRRKQVLMDLALNLTGIIGQRLAFRTFSESDRRAKAWLGMAARLKPQTGLSSSKAFATPQSAFRRAFCPHGQAVNRLSATQVPAWAAEICMRSA